MLHRAARNAYSWWWASHVRTKQSKWLDQNLQDMEEKVEYILKIIEEDGDTFRERAEMYYRKRPELVNFVEDSFRGYRALAERYDHLSKELQSANRTIASVFPESVNLSMDDDDFDGENFPASALPPDEFNKLPRKAPPVPEKSIPKNTNAGKKKNKMPTRLMSRKGLLKFDADETAVVSVPVSGLSKSDALEKIDKLQKEILALQTEKEFVKSSYEYGLEKYWNFEKQITELQSEVSNLQDEFGIGTVIEDDEARTLMTATALKSCQETLSRLREKQEQSAEEAKAEFQKIQEAREKFRSLKGMFESNQEHQEGLVENATRSEPTEDNNLDHEMAGEEQNNHNVESLRKKIKEELEVKFGTSLTMSELAEKVDELVEKIIDLETAVSSQSAHVKRLRSETNELQINLQSLEEEKESLLEGSHSMSKKIKDLEEELLRVQSLKECIRDKSDHLQAHFLEASCNLDNLSEKLLDVKPDEEAVNITPSSQAADLFGAHPFQQTRLHGMMTMQDTQVVSQDVKLGDADKHREAKELATPERTSQSNYHSNLLLDKDDGPTSNANVRTEAEADEVPLSSQCKNQPPANPVEFLVEGNDYILVGKALKQDSSTCEADNDQQLSQSNKHEIDSLLTAPDASPQNMLSQDENMIPGAVIGTLTDTQGMGMHDEVVEPSSMFIHKENIIPSDQSGNLHNEIRNHLISDVQADSCGSLFEEICNVRTSHINLATQGNSKVEPNIDSLGLPDIEICPSGYLLNEVRDLTDGLPEKSATNQDEVLLGKRTPTEENSVEQLRSRSPERDQDDNHSALGLTHCSRGAEKDNNNTSPEETISNSQDPSVNIHHTNIPNIQEKSHSKSSSQKESIPDAGISFLDNSTVSGDLEVVENLKKSISDQGETPHHPQQEKMYTTMERGVNTDQDELGVEEDDQPNWKELFLNGLDDREKLLLQEYTANLRNYKEARKKLNEVEKKNRASLFQYCIQIKVLKSANASKDEKIQALEKKLNLLQGIEDENYDSEDNKITANLDVPDNGSLIEDQMDLPVRLQDQITVSDSIDAATRAAGSEQPKISFIEDDGGIEVINIDKPHNPSVIEERIRTDIDQLLEENIEFWMKFSSSFHQIQKFQTTIHDLKAELANVKETNRRSGNTNHQSLISDIRPIYRHLSEIQTELTIWLDQTAFLNDDLENRLSSLSGIQEEITRLSNAGPRVEDSELTEYQAAKFHGEILNMRQENSKVADELHAGHERVKVLLVEIERTLKGLDAEFGISTRKPPTRNSTTRSRIPLRTFLFGVKLKKQKPSFFACISPSLQKQYSDLAALQT
ncbi:OLC1v1017219C1 [Oldenlandia corymbosa var. corymbosa]|uniref:OLC1v1017219C1 n=1 Tax=Oldenlandia corymbosa var. corymbosa TaxID=529605 RepID=A0AAV1E8W6_OLDCO|nr:OLC1v1017219C1 [Oldenlandia corymbosa var. corymbosa]